MRETKYWKQISGDEIEEFIQKHPYLTERQANKGAARLKKKGWECHVLKHAEGGFALIATREQEILNLNDHKKTLVQQLLETEKKVQIPKEFVEDFTLLLGDFDISGCRVQMKSDDAGDFEVLFRKPGKLLGLLFCQNTEDGGWFFAEKEPHKQEFEGGFEDLEFGFEKMFERSSR